MSQPDVSSVVHGRKTVAYAALRRVLRGLNVSPAYACLAFGACTSSRTRAAARVKHSPPSRSSGTPECTTPRLRERARGAR
jgi:hypothetical protein